MSGSDPARQGIHWGARVNLLCQLTLIQLSWGGVRALSKFHSVEVSDSKMIMTFPNLQLAVHLHSEGSSGWKLWHLVYHIARYINPPSEHMDA